MTAFQVVYCFLYSSTNDSKNYIYSYSGSLPKSTQALTVYLNTRITAIIKAKNAKFRIKVSVYLKCIFKIKGSIPKGKLGLILIIKIEFSNKR